MRVTVGPGVHRGDQGVGLVAQFTCER